MDGRRISEVTRPPESLPAIPRRPPERLPRSLALVLGLGWPLVAVIATALAPAPADPEAIPGLIDMAVSLAVLLGLFGTIGAAATRNPTALLWSIGLGVVWLGVAISCPLSGHHDVVGWQWYGELLASGGLLLVSLVGARRLRASRA